MKSFCNMSPSCTERKINLWIVRILQCNKDCEEMEVSVKVDVVELQSSAEGAGTLSGISSVPWTILVKLSICSSKFK